MITTLERLDREVSARHELTLMVRDRGTPLPRRSYARVTVNVMDVNDHAPEFLASHLPASTPQSLSNGPPSAPDRSLQAIALTRSPFLQPPTFQAASQYCNVDAAYCYRPSSVVCLSVCLSRS